MNLWNRTVHITGGAGGIGLALAQPTVLAVWAPTNHPALDLLINNASVQTRVRLDGPCADWTSADALFTRINTPPRATRNSFPLER